MKWMHDLFRRPMKRAEIAALVAFILVFFGLQMLWAAVIPEDATIAKALAFPLTCVVGGVAGAILMPRSRSPRVR